MKKAIAVFAIATMIKVASVYAGEVRLPSLQALQSQTTKIQKLEIAEKTTDAIVLAQLANDNWRVTRMAVAKNPNTPTDVLAKLATDKEWGVRVAVAQNSHTSSTTLTKLTTDRDAWVRENAMSSTVLVAAK